MLWRRATRPHPLRPAQPVPQGESVRMAALQAAWRRDHWVARRRIWFRWTLWGAQRYGVPAAGVLGLLLGLWFAVRAVMGWVDSSPASSPTLASTQQEPIKTPQTQQTTTTPAAPPTLTVGNNAGMLLKFDPAMSASAHTKTPVSSPASPEAAEIPIPQLISENWLHSKEP